MTFKSLSRARHRLVSPVNRTRDIIRDNTQTRTWRFVGDTMTFGIPHALSDDTPAHDSVEGLAP